MKKSKIIDVLGQAKQLLAQAKNNPKEAQIHIELADKCIVHALVLLTESH